MISLCACEAASINANNRIHKYSCRELNKGHKRRDEEEFVVFLISRPINHWPGGHSGKNSHINDQDKFWCKFLS